MKHRFILAVLVSIPSATVSASACTKFPLQDSPATQPPAASQATDSPATSTDPNASAQHKKVKKVWTNENLTEVSGSPISQIGDTKKSPSGNSNAAKPASSQEVANVRKQLAALQTQLSDIDKRITDLKSFSKGEASAANGMQLHKSYTREPIQDQILKLEEKRKLVAAQMDAVLDAARKRGVEPGQLR
jgi:hypothetical protein